MSVVEFNLLSFFSCPIFEAIEEKRRRKKRFIQSDVTTEFHYFASQALCSNTGNSHNHMLWPSNFRASHSNWKRSRNRPSKGFGIHSNRRKPRYRIWIEHSYFATFLRATNQINWLRLLEMLYLKISSGEWMKVDIEILGSKAKFVDPSGQNHPIEEGQGRRQDLMSANGSTNC